MGRRHSLQRHLEKAIRPLRQRQEVALSVQTSRDQVQSRVSVEGRKLQIRRRYQGSSRDQNLQRCIELFQHGSRRLQAISC